jgi:hypothetical protein
MDLADGRVNSPVQRQPRRTVITVAIILVILVTVASKLGGLGSLELSTLAMATAVVVIAGRILHRHREPGHAP